MELEYLIEVINLFLPGRDDLIEKLESIEPNEEEEDDDIYEVDGLLKEINSAIDKDRIIYYAFLDYQGESFYCYERSPIQKGLIEILSNSRIVIFHYKVDKVFIRGEKFFVNLGSIYHHNGTGRRYYIGIPVYRALCEGYIKRDYYSFLSYDVEISIRKLRESLEGVGFNFKVTY